MVCRQLEHVILGYLSHVWDKNDWLYKGQHGFRPGYSCESKVLTVCQDTADSLDEGVCIDAITIGFSKAFNLVPHDRLLTKLAASGMDSRVVVWVREFPVGHTQRVRVGGQLSKEVKVTSGVPQGSVLGPLMFLVYVNDIWRNIDLCIGFFTDDCVIWRKIINENDCSQTFLIYLFLRFACFSYRWFTTMHCKFNLSMYDQEPLVIGRRGCTGRDINKEMLAADNRC